MLASPQLILLAAAFPRSAVRMTLPARPLPQGGKGAPRPSKLGFKPSVDSAAGRLAGGRGGPSSLTAWFSAHLWFSEGQWGLPRPRLLTKAKLRARCIAVQMLFAGLQLPRKSGKVLCDCPAQC